MARNLLAESYLTGPTAHFPDGPNAGIHSNELRPIFEAQHQNVQDEIRRRIAKFDRTDVAGVARDLCVYESVAAGLIALLHPEG